MKPTCKTIRHLIMDLHGGERLSEAQQEALNAHLSFCPQCRSFDGEVTGLIGALKQPEMPSLPDAFFDGIRDSVLDAFEKPAPTRLSFRDWFPHFRWPVVLVPSFSGVVGIAIGIFVATAWIPHQGIRPASTGLQQTAQRTAVLPDKQATGEAALESDADLQTIDAIERYSDPDDILDAVGEEGAKEVLKDWENDMPAEVYDLVVS